MAKRKPKPEKARPARKRTTKRLVQATENLPPPAYKAHAEPEGDEPWDEQGLTVRQRRFITALIGPAGGNATKAAEMAGYNAQNRDSLRVTAAQNLSKPNVQQGIAHALAAQRLTPEWAKRQLADMAAASMANFVRVDENGTAVVDFAQAAASGALGQIKEIKEEVMTLPGGSVQVLKRTLKLHDRAAALALLLKFHGLVDGDDSSGGRAELLEADPQVDAARIPSGAMPSRGINRPVQDSAGRTAERKD